MIIHDCEQGSKAWWALRLGKPTVSRFSRFIQPSKLGYSAGAKGFVAELVAERLLGEPLDMVELDTMWTGRGTEMEAEARRFYSAFRNVEVRQVGFITSDSGDIGMSPDGLVGDDGGLEIKCRGAKAHMECVLGLTPVGDPMQIQGSLYISGRAWWDSLAYNPRLPKRIVRSYPESTAQAAIAGCVYKLLNDIETALEAVEKAGDVIEDDTALLHQLVESIKAGGAA